MKQTKKMNNHINIMLSKIRMQNYILVLFFTALSTLSGYAQTVSPFQTGDYMVDFIHVRDMAKMAPGLDVDRKSVV